MSSLRSTTILSKGGHPSGNHLTLLNFHLCRSEAFRAYISLCCAPGWWWCYAIAFTCLRSPRVHRKTGTMASRNCSPSTPRTTPWACVVSAQSGTTNSSSSHSTRLEASNSWWVLVDFKRQDYGSGCGSIDNQFGFCALCSVWENRLLAISQVGSIQLLVGFEGCLFRDGYYR
jgi:hypothetical protein